MALTIREIEQLKREAASPQTVGGAPICLVEPNELLTLCDELLAHRRAVDEPTVPRRLAPLCDEHGSGAGHKSGCPYCALVKLSHALSRIDYLCGEPNDMQCSGYDVHQSEDAVVEHVEACLSHRRAVEGEKPATLRQWKPKITPADDSLRCDCDAPPSHAQGVAEHEPHELFCPHCNPCRHREKLNEYDAMLRALCSFLGAGGYNVTHAGLIEAKSADEKIRWGIDHVLEVERKRATAQGVAQGLEMAANACKCIANTHREGSIRRDVALACEEEIRSLITEGKQA